MTGSELLMAGAAAQRIDVSRTTIHYWAKSGKLPVAQVVNGVRLFRAADVDRLAEERKAGAA